MSEPAAPAPRPYPDRAGSLAAAARFARVRRRWWRHYAIALAVTAAVVAAGVIVAWRTGEAAHAHLQVAAQPAPDLPRTDLSDPLTEAWHTGDRLADGDPVIGGTVITWSGHTVNGRDARTGAVVWSYTRTDSRLCAVAQEQGKTLALYARSRSCDQIDTFDSTTGQRAWQRTLDAERTPVRGTPGVVATSDSFFVYTAETIYAVRIDSGACEADRGINCGYNYWQYVAASDCAIRSIAVGALGVLISQRCADGDELLLHDRYRGPDDKGYDPVRWTAPKVSAVPFTTDFYIGAIDPATGTLETFDQQSGKALGGPVLTPKPELGQNADARSYGQVIVLHAGSRCYGILLDEPAQQWQRACSALPTRDREVDNLVYLPSASGVQPITARTGEAAAVLAGPDTTGASALVRAGSGFVVGSDHGTSFLG